MSNRYVLGLWLFVPEGPRPDRYEVAVAKTTKLYFHKHDVIELPGAAGYIQPERGAPYGIVRGGPNRAIVERLMIIRRKDWDK